MKKLTLSYEWKEWRNTATNEVKMYRVYFVEYNGIKIPVKPADYTAQQILNQIYDTLESSNE